MNHVPEVWLPVQGHEDRYEVSNHGRVRSFLRADLLQPSKTHGYEHVTLVARDGTRTSARIHVLVLSAFCGPRPFPEAHAAHNDGNRENNRLTNLRWATARDNQDDVKRHGRRVCGEDVYGAKLTETGVRRIRKRLSTGERYSSIADDFAVSISTISLISRNRIWKHVA